MSDALERALLECENLLEKERRDGADEALVLAKEAAVAKLAEAAAAASPQSSAELQTRLLALLASNRFCLKWSELRMRLASIGQTAPAPQGLARPRIDLVH